MEESIGARASIRGLTKASVLLTVCVGVGALFLAASPDYAEHLKFGGGKPSPKPGKNKKGDNKPGGEDGATASKGLSQEEGSRRSLDFYAKRVRPSMFSSPQAAPPKVIVVSTPPPAPEPKPIPAPPPFVPEVIPFADWAYTGYVTMGEAKMALIENTKTKEGRYLKVGESFLGAEVSQLTNQMISFTSGVKPYALAKSDNINVVQLDRSAAYLGGSPPPVQPGAPGQPVNVGFPAQMPPGFSPPPTPIQATTILQTTLSNFQEPKDVPRATLSIDLK